jgi:hypothetical protein
MVEHKFVRATDLVNNISQEQVLHGHLQLPSQCKLCPYPQSTYIYRYHVYVPSSQLRISHLPTRQRVCPSPRNQRGGGGLHLPAGEGLGESQFRRLEKMLSTLPTLCPYPLPSSYAGEDADHSQPSSCKLL